MSAPDLEGMPDLRHATTVQPKQGTAVPTRAYQTDRASPDTPPPASQPANDEAGSPPAREDPASPCPLDRRRYISVDVDDLLATTALAADPPHGRSAAGELIRVAVAAGKVAIDDDHLVLLAVIEG